MTVKELIELLQEYPQDIPVAITWFLDVTKDDFVLVKEFPKGDPANPKCEYLDLVLNIV